MSKRFVLINLSICITSLVWSNKINVPADYAKIQQGIDHASDGDTILVKPGTYTENINFRTKKIVLTSYFFLNHDTSYITKTIINGSNPTNQDTASCVIIIKGQDSTTMLQGFTLTGGKGTAWLDEHGAGKYREGGAILIEKSSPVIQYNLIINNAATNSSGLSGSGGGGIRAGDCNPKILNNVIINNTAGQYGGGIVLNYCDAVIRNNIIANNSGGTSYGGGSMWVNSKLKTGNVVENNTIVNNHSNLYGGGINLLNNTSIAVIKNNIIFGNSAPSSPQLALSGAPVSVTYCDVEGGNKGIGNIDANPQFSDSSFYLKNSSPGIDAGDTSKTNLDPADPQKTNKALFPSKGFIRNDIGAYGGPGASLLPNFKTSNIMLVPSALSFGDQNKMDSLVKKKIILINQSSYKRKIDSVIVMKSATNLKIKYFPSTMLDPTASDSIIIEWTPKDNEKITDTLLIYPNASDIAKPIKMAVSGSSKNSSVAIKVIDLNNSIQIVPNPFSVRAQIKYTCNNFSNINIYDLNGRNIKTYKGLKGRGELEFDSEKLKSGLYICQMVSTNNSIIFDKLEIVK